LNLTFESARAGLHVPDLRDAEVSNGEWPGARQELRPQVAINSFLAASTPSVTASSNAS
jgi:hypothetical protein